MREIILDTETTGLSTKDGHRIVEIGCIELVDLVPTKKTFHSYINPERSVSKDALDVHGYTDEFLSSKKKFSEIAEDFLKFIDNAKIVIHNASFDISFLNNELSLCGKNLIKKDSVVDTLEIARNKFPGSSNSLDALCKRYRIDNSKRTKHTAVIDCELLSKVYVNLIGQKEPSLNFTNYQEKSNLNGMLNDNYSKKIVKPSIEEEKMHKEFLKKYLKKNFF